MIRMFFFTAAVYVSAALTGAHAQEGILDSLTVKKIMRDPRWMGVSPGRIRWSPDSKTVLFEWNPENAPEDSLYSVHWTELSPRKLTENERE